VESWAAGLFHRYGAVQNLFHCALLPHAPVLEACCVTPARNPTFDVLRRRVRPDTKPCRWRTSPRVSCGSAVLPVRPTSSNARNDRMPVFTAYINSSARRVRCNSASNAVTGSRLKCDGRRPSAILRETCVDGFTRGGLPVVSPCTRQNRIFSICRAARRETDGTIVCQEEYRASFGWYSFLRSLIIKPVATVRLSTAVLEISHRG
jgi:hypothetical protein